jgi:hypothetical protein
MVEIILELLRRHMRHHVTFVSDSVGTRQLKIIVHCKLTTTYLQIVSQSIVGVSGSRLAKCDEFDPVVVHLIFVENPGCGNGSDGSAERMAGYLKFGKVLWKKPPKFLNSFKFSYFFHFLQFFHFFQKLTQIS